MDKVITTYYVLFVLAASLMPAIASGFGAQASYPDGFHNGGTGNCEGCHAGRPASALRNTSSAAKGGATPAGLPRQSMLNGSDPSSTCLICHSAPAGQKQPSGFLIASSRESLSAVAQTPSQLTPGGDFGWLLKTYKWSSKGGGANDSFSPGDSHGHNVVAQDYGFSADMVNAVAPGGTYPADRLSCISCHDPHGNYRRSASGAIGLSGMPIRSSGSYSDSADPDSAGTVGTYRLLAGVGYQPASLAGDFAFKADPPAAVSPPAYNRAETSADTRVAYGKGMSEWCRNCHVTTHKNAHPMGSTGKLTTEVIRIYNQYVTSGNRTGSKSSSYNSLVPYEMGTDDYSVLKATANSNATVRSGPQNGANVMCLSCHRAHASGWDHMTRWNLRNGVIVNEGTFVGTDSKSPASSASAQGRHSVETAKAYYDSKPGSFAVYQRSMCSKCHEKD